MKTLAFRAARLVAAVALPWATVAAVHSMKTTNRSIASMALVLEVLATSTLGDRLLAIVASLSAAFGFSWYYVDEVGNFAITTAEGELTFFMMMLTALTGSHLAIRAQNRAAEAIHRRAEMEQLHQLGTALLASVSVESAAQDIVNRLVKLFGVRGAVLTLQDHSTPFEGGARQGSAETVLQSEGARYSLDLYGHLPSTEVRNALKNLIDLVLDRARAAEQHARGEAAHRGEEFRKTVLNSLAHNFRTPLTSIKASATAMLDDIYATERDKTEQALDQDARKEMLQVIDEEADRLDRFVEGLTKLARIDAGDMRLQLQPASVEEMVATALKRAEPRTRSHRLEVWLDELPLVTVDEQAFSEAIYTLIDNAAKYSPPESPITIRATQKGDSLIVISVEDRGPGIRAEVRDRVFEKFFRAMRDGDVSDRRVSGTGMGLAIARGIVEAHHGRIWVEDAEGGKGARFVIELPINSLSQTPDDSNGSGPPKN